VGGTDKLTYFMAISLIAMPAALLILGPVRNNFASLMNKF
jgi:hypothetical protein